MPFPRGDHPRGARHIFGVDVVGAAATLPEHLPFEPPGNLAVEAGADGQALAIAIVGHLTEILVAAADRGRGQIVVEHDLAEGIRSEEHTSELQSLMRISYAVFCLQKKNKKKQTTSTVYN